MEEPLSLLIMLLFGMMPQAKKVAMPAYHSATDVAAIYVEQLFSSSIFFFLLDFSSMFSILDK